MFSDVDFQSAHFTMRVRRENLISRWSQSHCALWHSSELLNFGL